MAKFIISPNLEEYNRKIYDLGAKAQPIIEKAVKEGAAPMADAVRAAINALPTDDSYIRKGSGKIKSGPATAQKQAMLNGFGIAPIRNDNGFVNVKIGFDGYSNIVTKRWPQGQPIPMIANAVEAGTSFMSANPFMSQTVNSQRKNTENKIKEVFESEILKIIN